MSYFLTQTGRFLHVSQRTIHFYFEEEFTTNKSALTTSLPTAFQLFKDLLDTTASQHLTLNHGRVYFSRLMHQYVMGLDVFDATLEPLLATQLHFHPDMIQVKKPEGYCAGKRESTSCPKLQWNLAWWILHLAPSFFSKTPTSNAEITIQKQWTELMIVLPAAKKKQGAVASHRRGWKKTKYPRNGSNKMESLTRVLEMRWRRRWKHEDKDKWAEDMFGAGEAASETALSGGLTQTDRAPPLRSRRSPSYSSLIPLKKKP